MDTQTTIGGRIREHRAALQLRQQDVSARSGVSVSLISRYESGRSEPTLRILRMLARALECSVSDLTGDA